MKTIYEWDGLWKSKTMRGIVKHMKDRQTPAESSREWFLDFLRIAATYGIVMLHMSPLDTDIYGVETAPWKTFICMSILFRWCVPAFFMISGALFLSPRKTLNIKKLYAKTIFRMVCSFLFWSGLYAMAHCIIMDKGKWTFLNQWLRGHYHMWYVFVAIGLYILTPVLRGLTQSRKLTEYYLIIGFVFTYLLPRALSLLLLFNPPHADVIQSFQAAVSQINPLAGCYQFSIDLFLILKLIRLMLSYQLNQTQGSTWFLSLFFWHRPPKTLGIS